MFEDILRNWLIKPTLISAWVMHVLYKFNISVTRTYLTTCTCMRLFKLSVCLLSVWFWWYVIIPLLLLYPYIDFKWGFHHGKYRWAGLSEIFGIPSHAGSLWAVCFCQIWICTQCNCALHCKALHPNPPPYTSQLNTAVYWYYWAWTVRNFISGVLSCRIKQVSFWKTLILINISVLRCTVF